MTEKATIRIHVRLDEAGNATACTEQDMEHLSVTLDDATHIEGATRDLIIDVTASLPEPEPAPEADVSVDVADGVSTASASVAEAAE